MEKAGWYIELGSLNADSVLNQKTCLQSSGLNSLPISSSQLPVEPPIRRQRHATW